MRIIRKDHLAKFLCLSIAVIVSFLLAGCLGEGTGTEKHLRPVSVALKIKMKQKDMDPNAPVLVRIFKEESILEVWKQTRTGNYALLKTFPICKWSGALGPKFEEGDRQAPEGYYAITPALMNPNSLYHLSFNLGFPNAYDRAHGRTGSHLMVHGGCSSRGCYAMEDDPVQDIYALARDAFRGGQRVFHVHAYPFRMTPENMARHADSPHMDFWWMLKTGYDHFELTRRPPDVKVCERRYVFDAVPLDKNALFMAEAPCPAMTLPDDLQERLVRKQTEDKQRYAAAQERFHKREGRQEEQSQLAKIGETESATEFVPTETETRAADGIVILGSSLSGFFPTTPSRKQANPL